MKRVIAVAILLTLTMSAPGCRVLRSCRSRGAPCQSAGPAACASSEMIPGAIPANTSYYGGTGCEACNGGNVVGSSSAPYSSYRGAPVEGQIIGGQVLGGQVLGGGVVGAPIEGQIIGGQMLGAPNEGLPLGSNLTAPQNGYFSHVVSDRKMDATTKLPAENPPLDSAKKASVSSTN